MQNSETVKTNAPSTKRGPGRPRKTAVEPSIQIDSTTLARIKLLSQARGSSPEVLLERVVAEALQNTDTTIKIRVSPAELGVLKHFAKQFDSDECLAACAASWLLTWVLANFRKVTPAIDQFVRYVHDENDESHQNQWGFMRRMVEMELEVIRDQSTNATIEK